MVIVAEPLPGAAMAAGAKLAVAPAGKPVADSASEELKLPTMAVLIVEAPDPLCNAVSGGVAEEHFLFFPDLRFVCRLTNIRVNYP